MKLKPGLEHHEGGGAFIMGNAGQAAIASGTEIRNAQQACEALAIEYAEIGISFYA